MIRRTKGGKKVATPSGKEKLTVDLPSDLKIEFKVHCITNGVAMTEILESLIRNYLDGQKKDKGAM